MSGGRRFRVTSAWTSQTWCQTWPWHDHLALHQLASVQSCSLRTSNYMSYWVLWGKGKVFVLGDFCNYKFRCVQCMYRLFNKPPQLPWPPTALAAFRTFLVKSYVIASITKLLWVQIKLLYFFVWLMWSFFLTNKANKMAMKRLFFIFLVKGKVNIGKLLNWISSKTICAQPNFAACPTCILYFSFLLV